MYTIPDALWGTVTRIMTITIPAFIIYGAVVLKCGGAEALINLSSGLAGRFTGGPAKIAVLASGLFGMINGSSVANAATTGSVTIPMMKKIGYPPHIAASVESCASTGGLIMPPVMGADAFLMTTFLGIPYLTVAIAAFIPACLYF
ncbi:TRAP transporter large permease subunit, partial [Chloroflexota bacterium]